MSACVRVTHLSLHMSLTTRWYAKAFDLLGSDFSLIPDFRFNAWCILGSTLSCHLLTEDRWVTMWWVGRVTAQVTSPRQGQCTEALFSRLYQTCNISFLRLRQTELLLWLINRTSPSSSERWDALEKPLRILVISAHAEHKREEKSISKMIWWSR